LLWLFCYSLFLAVVVCLAQTIFDLFLDLATDLFFRLAFYAIAQ
jgi:hypothetical protein